MLYSSFIYVLELESWSFMLTYVTCSLPYVFLILGKGLINCLQLCSGCAQTWDCPVYISQSAEIFNHTAESSLSQFLS